MNVYDYGFIFYFLKFYDSLQPLSICVFSVVPKIFHAKIQRSSYVCIGLTSICIFSSYKFGCLFPDQYMCTPLYFTHTIYKILHVLCLFIYNMSISITYMYRYIIYYVKEHETYIFFMLDVVTSQLLALFFMTLKNQNAKKKKIINKNDIDKRSLVFQFSYTFILSMLRKEIA